ncbi:MAG: hypothetical protein ACRDTH_15740 [Pseudonocardiaceae bacterium]
MDALDVLGALRRQWVTTLLVGALLLGALGAMVAAMPVEYSTFATVLGVQRNPNRDVNPYGLVDQAQTQAATVAVTVLQDPRIITDLKTKGATANFTVSNERGPVQDPSSLMTISVTGPGPAVVLTTAQMVVQRARDELRRLQEEFGVPPEWQLVLTDIVKPTTVATSRGAQLRAVAIAGALGIAVALLLMVVVDRARTSRIREYAGPAFASSRYASDGTRDATEAVPGPGDR